MVESLKSHIIKLDSIEAKISFFRDLTIPQKVSLLLNLPEKFRQEILLEITESEVIDIFEYEDPDEAADMINCFDEYKQKRILNKLNKDVKKKVNFLLKFSPDSAAGIMSLNYIIVDLGTSLDVIKKRIKQHISHGKKEPSILVVNDQGKFIGELRISNLLFENQHSLYSKIRDLPTVKYNEDQEEVIDIFNKNKREKVVVLDIQGFILGIIHARDIFKVIEEENTEDFYGIAGLQKEEDIGDKALDKVRYRLRWLILNLFTAFLAAYVVSSFEDTISQFVLLAAFMPIVAGMGGNAGTQTTAILIRSLALKHIDVSFGKRILVSEFFAAIINGLIIGIIVGSIAYIFEQNILFGLVVGLSNLLNLIVASIFGTIVPLVLKAFNLDPAAASNVFVTTMTDVLGFFIFLSLATVVLL